MNDWPAKVAPSKGSSPELSGTWAELRISLEELSPANGARVPGEAGAPGFSSGPGGNLGSSILGCYLLSVM